MPTDLGQRIQRLSELFELVKPVPQEWLDEAKKEKEKREGTAEPLKSSPCTSYKTLTNAWKKAIYWLPEIDDALSVMLAVCLSTDQIGEQLFLQLIAAAGSLKTKLCDALLVSSKCKVLESITGFHSGAMDASGDDYSFIARANHKTLITPEGDLMVRNPKFLVIMAEQRRIFDGSSSAVYKNRKKDIVHTGLRTPWIMAGTPAMLCHDQSQLGDRFLKVFMESPEEEVKKEIVATVGYTALRCVRTTSNGKPDGQMDPALAETYRLSGGYVDYLRLNAESLISQLVIDEDRVVRECSTLGEFTAKMRAREVIGGEREIESLDEMPTRLVHQFVRLACCIAVVLNRPTIDSEVMRRVRKVSRDTCRGGSMDIVDYLAKHPEEPGQRRKP